MRSDKKSQKQTDLNLDYSAKKNLFDTEEGLISYNQDLIKKFRKGLGLKSNQKSVDLIEFGAGSGALAEIWRSEFGISPICIEIDDILVERLKAKGFITFKDISNINNLAPLVYTSNVLEHIEDDVTALKKIKEKMQKGGLLAIYVPALPCLYSDHDRKIGHFRRYRKTELMKKVTLAGFKIEDCYYNDCIGVLAELSVKLFGWNGKSGLGSEKSFIFYDKIIYPVSKILDRLIFRKVIGKNLFLFAVNE